MSREPIRHPRKFQPKTMSLLVLCGIRRRFHRLSPCDGYVAHALRTLAPVAARSIATPALPLDLHVLSLPLAFILSQDQTLHCINLLFLWLWDFLLKESSLALSIVCYNILSCLYFCLPIIQSTAPPLSKGTAKIHIFSFPPNLFKNIFCLLH